MRELFSTPVPPPPLLNTPWRQINWSDRQSDDRHYLDNYKLQTNELQLRILLHGPVGAGKSSFINSVKSVLEGEMCRLAMMANMTNCCTKEYKTYKIQKGSPGTFYSFVFSDTMGLRYNGRRNRKVYVKDIKRVMKGNVKDGYTFNPECKISKDDQHYNESPTANDKVHVLVCVIDANTAHLIKKEDVEAIQDIREEANELGIPQVTILTKIDEAFPEIKRDVKNVYKSKKLQQKMEEFSADVGVPMNCIFPVKNYHAEIDLNNDIDALILNTLRNIVSIGENSLNNA